VRCIARLKNLNQCDKEVTKMKAAAIHNFGDVEAQPQMYRVRDLKLKRTVPRRQLPVPVRAMVRITAILLLTGLVASTKAVAQQSAFAPGSGPTVLFDLGHNSLFLMEPNLWIAAAFILVTSLSH